MTSYPLCLNYSTAQFKLTTCVQVHVCACTFNACKIQKLPCACTVVCYFGVRKRDSKHTRHTRDACHELALCLLHYMCGVTTGTVMKYNCFAADWLLYML